MIIRDILEHNARIHPNKIALCAKKEEVTYLELRNRVLRRAAALQNLGITLGDRVAILANNTIEFVELFFATAHLGASIVQLHPSFVSREMNTIIQNAGVRGLIYEESLSDKIEEIRPSLADIPGVLCMNDPRMIASEVEADQIKNLPRFDDRTIAFIAYTSGPTGRLRGAMLSNRNLMTASVYSAMELGFSRKDVFLSCATLPYLGGLGRLLRFFHVGATVILQKEFDPVELLRTIERRSVTHAVLTPSMMARILDTPDARHFNLATLRMVLYGGAWISVDLMRRAISFFRCSLVQSYAHVETTGILTFLHEEDHSMNEGAPYMKKLMSVGKEALGLEVRVVDEDGNEVPAGMVGEVAARGMSIFEGYLHDPEATAKVLRDNWFYSGDLAAVDEDGYIHIVDRKHDSLLVESVNVSLKEVESIVAEHPAVKEAAVVGRPDFTMGEVPVAVVVLKDGFEENPEDILEHCRRNMAPFKVPRSVEFLSAFPKNAQGKVTKATIRDRITSRNR
ncbi:MAG: AMP-binding protein [Syntrophorhabdaceae bacterium]|nr:AMP-binding protein [Syntrophorhabdaceae bacterium]